ncbi:MAG: hypothetical protein LHW45_01905 [Candidatus Cloacimonetes bacterium]|jgi:hypothetical protein|nr:hypothetical protein [Candidatus Cloacimonadota bacterium]MDY0366368.1 hypothetical protein [Candidatus Syntrophosphaera sp.]HOY85629.1 hypothetical protein [Candidatus Syntrophosphaera sp.]
MQDCEVQFYLLGFASRGMSPRQLERWGLDQQALRSNLEQLLARDLLRKNGGSYRLSSAGIIELRKLARKLGKRGSSFLLPALENGRSNRLAEEPVYVPLTRRRKFWYGRG